MAEVDAGMIETDTTIVIPIMTVTGLIMTAGAVITATGNAGKARLCLACGNLDGASGDIAGDAPYQAGKQYY